MDKSTKENLKMATNIAIKAARMLLTAAEDAPYFGPVAKLINKVIDVCDQVKCNKGASKALQARFCRLSEHMFSGPNGLAAVALAKPNNALLAMLCTRMEDVLNEGVVELSRFSKRGFISSILQGAKPQRVFEGLDQDMTDCFHELAAGLQVVLLQEQAQIYDVVCDIQTKIDQRGGLEGLMADPAQLQSLAAEIGADVQDLKSEVVDALAALGTQVSVVDENVRAIQSQLSSVYQAVDEILKNTSTKATDLSSLQLTSRPVVDRSQPLGEGAFGKVYKGIYNHMEVAVKEVSGVGSLSAAQLAELSREVLMHSKVGNLPGVTRLFGANLTVEPRCIVLELADGSLHDALHKKLLAIDLTLSTKLSLVAQLCSTLAAISDLNLIHRDIKSSNVLLFVANGRVYAKLADFGLTKMVNESTMSGGATPKGTPPYMAPELFRGEYSTASDMYAFAVLVNELMTEQVPFPNCSYVEIVQSVGTFRKRPVAFAAEPSDVLGCELVRLIGKCWHQDPALRMSFHELSGELQHVLRKAVEVARVGNHSSPLTPPRPATTQIEAAITELCGWLTVSCHVAEPDAMSLAHTLVTVKDISTPAALSKVLHRSPGFLSKDMSQSAVIEANIVSALSNGSSSSSASAKLESLNTTQLCELIDHCNMPAKLSAFVVQNNLEGSHLDGAVDSVEDLIELGLNKMDAKVLYKRIAEWKQNGLPSDFTPTVSATSSAKSTVPTSNPLPAPPTTTPTNPSTTTTSLLSPVDLDNALGQANFAGDNRAAAAILAAADAGDHLAEAAVSVVYNSGKCSLLPKSPALALVYAQRALPWLLANAGGGSVQVHFYLAVLYAAGRAVEKDENAAFRHFKLAADQGHVHAQNNLANCYAQGLGVLLDKSAGAHYYKLAAEQGHIGALVNLGMCYTYGNGVPQNDQQAASLYYQAAQLGSSSAQAFLGVCFGQGKGVEKNELQAVRYHKLAADQGDTTALQQLGNCYLNGRGVPKNEHEAVRLYKLIAENDQIPANDKALAHYSLAFCYERGAGVVQNKAESVRYLKLAADQGNPDAQLIVGQMYINGNGVPINIVGGLQYLKLAADQGHAEALHYCGQVCMAAAEQRHKAMGYFQRAADQGHAPAQFDMGQCYEEGVLVGRDLQEAGRYYKLAAAQGHAAAQAKLAPTKTQFGWSKNPFQ